MISREFMAAWQVGIVADRDIYDINKKRLLQWQLSDHSGHFDSRQTQKKVLKNQKFKVQC